MSAARAIQFRIGINLGDVIVEDGDIFGEGVNLAARLEALAEPGAVYVSAVVRDQVGDRLDVGFEDLGEQQREKHRQASPGLPGRIGQAGRRGCRGWQDAGKVCRESPRSPCSLSST